MSDSEEGLYIQMFSIHGLVRSSDIEMGRDADTGGQVKYVIEMAETLGRQKGVAQIDLFTRQIKDKRVAAIYGRELERISDNVRLVRVGTTNARRKLLRNLHKEKSKLESMGFDVGHKLLAEHFGVSETDVIDAGGVVERLAEATHDVGAAITDLQRTDRPAIHHYETEPGNTSS